MRGERELSKPLGRVIPGSSPHARGTPKKDLLGMPILSVHPRMRGERVIQQVADAINRGSSPHARGTHPARRRVRGDHRFIPACAGNATDLPLWPDERSVHPRMRGERWMVSVSALTTGGSSPHARGTQTRLALTCDRPWFIPACAGNADTGRRGWQLPPVHPRMRGERTSNKLLIYRRKSEPSDSTKHSGC